MFSFKVLGACAIEEKDREGPLDVHLLGCYFAKVGESSRTSTDPGISERQEKSNRKRRKEHR